MLELTKSIFSRTIILVMADHEQIPVSSAIEDYAKAIYALQERGESAVSTTALAERLGVTPASASGMVKKLGELGLVEHAPYHGVSLTENGQRLVVEVIRNPGLLAGGGFEVIEKQAFGGPLFVRFANDVHVLGGTLARAMRVELADERR